MARIATTQATFDPIAATLPLGSVSFENATNERGERYGTGDGSIIEFRSVVDAVRCAIEVQNASPSNPAPRLLPTVASPE